jgi:hypothetical protein
VSKRLFDRTFWVYGPGERGTDEVAANMASFSDIWCPEIIAIREIEPNVKTPAD